MKHAAAAERKFRDHCLEAARQAQEARSQRQLFESETGPNILLRILDLARMAPSAHNTQPWRFEIIADDRVAIHGRDAHADGNLNFDGRDSHMAHGALLETLRLAATRFGRKSEWRIRPGQPDDAPIYDITLRPSDEAEDPLAEFIESRTTQRRPMRTTPLLAAQKEALIAAVGDDYTLQFFESFADRLAVAHLLWNSAYLRLTCPETYALNRDAIEWNVRYSMDRVPDQAIGVDPLTSKLMKWVLQSWKRVEFFNRYLLGTIIPRIQMDFIPGLTCGAHVLLRPKRRQAELIDHLAAGVAMQRLWLTATRVGLFLHPEILPVIFRWFVQADRQISLKPEINRGAVELARQFERLSSSQSGDGFAFLGRVGAAQPPQSRSIRKPLRELLR